MKENAEIEKLEETTPTEELEVVNDLEKNAEIEDNNLNETEDLIAEENTTEVDDNTTTEKPKKKGKTATKHIEAAIMVKKAREIAKDAENQLDECSLLLASDLKDYDEAKNSLLYNSLNDSEELLNKLGYKKEKEQSEEDTVVYEAKEQPRPMVVKDISTGGFVHSILALFAGLLTLVGLVYVASTKVNFTPDFSKVPTLESFNLIFNWYSALIGAKGNPLVGLAAMVFAALLVMIIVYKLFSSRKANKNLVKAEALLNDAQEYSSNKESCKEKMEIVDKHIKDSILTLNTYEVILKEQKAKLERILFIESDKVESSDFHEKSIVEMNDTQSLIGSVEEFIAEPMSSEGELSTRSIMLLRRSQDQIQQVLNRLY
jgi:hypothetical protein